MSLDNLKRQLPEYAKDIKLNLGTVPTGDGAPGLSQEQIHAVALTAAITARNAAVTADIEAAVRPHISEATLRAVRAAAAIMAMNNIYYRSRHLLSNKEYAKMPARLRMNVIANPGVEPADFELYCLTASAINGCGTCLDAHERQLIQHGFSADGIHSAIRIASVIHAAAVTLEYSQATLSEAA